MTLPRIALLPARGCAQLDCATHGLIVLVTGDALPADFPHRARWLERK